MSNGNAEQLHPLQNTWCIWEHKVSCVQLVISWCFALLALAAAEACSRAGGGA